MDIADAIWNICPAQKDSPRCSVHSEWWVPDFSLDNMIILYCLTAACTWGGCLTQVQSQSPLHTHWVIHTVPVQEWTWDHGCISISGAMRYILFLTMNNLLTSLPFSLPSQLCLQQAELNCILLSATKSPNLFNYNKNIPSLGFIIKTSLRISMVTAMNSALGNTVF